MIVVRVSSEEYEEELKRLNQVHAFNSPKFAMLNNLWVDEIHFLLFKTSKVELAITLGERNQSLLSPWSAPFGGFAFRDDFISIEVFEASIIQLKKYAKFVNCKLIEITLPPDLYASRCLTKLRFVLDSHSKFKISDINYYFDLEDNTISNRLNRNFRRNIKKSEVHALQLHLCLTNEEKELAYNVIEENRTSQSYPLRMGFEQLLTTSNIIEIDFFILQNTSDIFASAICYQVSNEVVQVIYWGDYTSKRGFGAMHQLSIQLRNYYWAKSFRFIDVGPSSEKGIPNFGLCSFKEAIGCDVSLKNSYTIEINE